MNDRVQILALAERTGLSEHIFFGVPGREDEEQAAIAFYNAAIQQYKDSALANWVGGPVATVEWDKEHDETGQWRRGKLNERGMQLDDGVHLYTADQLIADRKPLEEEIERLKDQLDQTETAGKLMDAWIAENGKQMPWCKAVELIHIVMKTSAEERDRLLCLDYPDHPALVEELRQQLAEAKAKIEQWKERYDCNTAIMHARTKNANTLRKQLAKLRQQSITDACQYEEWTLENKKMEEEIERLKRDISKLLTDGDWSVHLARTNELRQQLAERDEVIERLSMAVGDGERNIRGERFWTGYWRHKFTELRKKIADSESVTGVTGDAP